MTPTAVPDPSRLYLPIHRPTWGHELDDRTASVEEFCRRMWPQLVGTLTVICRSRPIAEELAQETLIRVWDHWDRVSGLDSPEGWAHRVAVNLSSSWWRRRRAERRANERLPTEERGTEPLDTADAMTVRGAVHGLPDRQRTVLALRYYADLSVEDTAAAMDCAPGTVKSLTSKALDNLRARHDLTGETAHGR